MTSLLNFSEGGPADAPVLLLVHPMGADLTFWDACRADWEKTYRCIAMDLPNAGKSPRASAPASMEEQATELEAFRRSLGLKRVIPVGCAVGSIIATVYAGLFHQHCDALIISNPGYRTRPEAKTMLAKRAAAVRAGGMAAILPGVIDSTFLGCQDDERREAFLRIFAAQDPDAYALQIEGMLDADTSPHLAAIDFPTLIVSGGLDRLLPHDHAEHIHATLPASELVRIEEGAHFIPYQRPREFAPLVRSFIDRL